MRIVDVCAFYSPQGGGVRTYIEAKLRAAARFGHEMIVLAPGPDHSVVQRAPGGYLATIPAPALPVDRRYRYFDDDKALHRALDEWRPDHVEASSPWSSATMVGRWDGAASRSLVMHADPLSAYAYRLLGGIAPIPTIDRWFGWFWNHLRGLDRMFDMVVCANDQLSGRLRNQGLGKVETIAMGVERGVFSPIRRSPELRRDLLASLGLDPSALLLMGIGRFAAEKRWEMVLRAAARSGRTGAVGLVLVGDGPRRRRLEILADQSPHAMVLPPIRDRSELATLLASADALVHGCEAETFCMVAAEARASGVPLIVPDRGAAVDQLVPGGGAIYKSGSERSLADAITGFAAKGRELQRARAVQNSSARTMDQHFEQLFARYAEIGCEPDDVPAAEAIAIGAPLFAQGLATSTGMSL
ncbi:MAG: glycosyltransferase [Sphingomonas sp.]|nr:glycosyltransferase [Sphingomonas sp.]MBV9529324.1 glycosyltransferase [Sphingomonas sp.]